ncbi:MAG: response regulator [Chloroflexi bacterium]|nr:response regulator [Chloroflexota bacterium]
MTDPVETHVAQSPDRETAQPAIAARGLRHDLRTPINHIVGYAELLLEDAGNPALEALSPALEQIRALAQEALRHLTDVLDAADDSAHGRRAVRGKLRPLLDQIAGHTADLKRRSEQAAIEGVLADLDRIDGAVQRLHTLLDAAFGPTSRTRSRTAAKPRTATARSDGAAEPEPMQSTRLSGTLLVVDDDDGNRDMLSRRLERSGCAVITAADGEQALAILASRDIDLVLLDIMMPGVDGFAVLERRVSDPRLRDIPVVVMSAIDEMDSVVRCIRMGAEDFLPKPFNPDLLLARAGACLERKRMRDQEKALLATVQSQAEELAELNQTLEARVEAQVSQLERLGRLQRFLSPELAQLIVSSGDESLLESHRSEITVVFTDLRGFTAFAEIAEPEDVTRVLREYHSTLGPLIFEYEGTLERFTGDGLMVFFNDPIPCDDPALRAVKMAVAMREKVAALTERWRRLGYELEFGVGIALGYATCGRIGFEGRYDYGAIGTVTNLAARLCSEAKPGQILVSQRVCLATNEHALTEPIGELSFKGFARPVPAFNVVALRTPDAVSAG